LLRQLVALLAGRLVGLSLSEVESSSVVARMSQYEPANAPFNTNPPSEQDRVLDATLIAYTDREILLES
jgi:hypothetical protein